MLRELLLILLGTGSALVVAVAAVGWLTWNRLRRRNAVGAHRHAPLAWLWSPGRAARLHRRLARSVAMVRSGPIGADSTLAPTAATLQARAELLDAELVRAARTGVMVRTRLLVDLAPRVRQVERLCARLCATGRRLDQLVPGTVEASWPDPVTEQLDAFDAAIRELGGDPNDGRAPLTRAARPARLQLGRR